MNDEKPLEGDALLREKSRLILEIKDLKRDGKDVAALARRAADLEARVVAEVLARGEDASINRVSLAGLLENVDLADAIGAYEEIVRNAREGLPGWEIKTRLLVWVADRLAILSLASTAERPDLPKDFCALLDSDANQWCRDCVLARRVLWGALLFSEQEDAKGSFALAEDLWYHGGECRGCGRVIPHGGSREERTL